MEENLSASEDGEINRYHFRKRPSSQLENMRKSVIRRKISKDRKRKSGGVSPPLIEEDSQDYTEEDESHCDIIIKEEPLFEMDDEVEIQEEEELDDSQNYFEEVSMEPPMVSDECDDTTLDEESDPLCCGPAFPPSEFTTSPNDVPLETLDDCDLVYKDPLTLNTLNTSRYTQTFFIKKETEIDNCVKEEEEDSDNDSKEQLLKNELSETSFSLNDNVRVECNNEQNWDKITEFNCSNLFKSDSTECDTVNAMEYVSCQSVQLENKSIEINSNVTENVQVVRDNLLTQISSGEDFATSEINIQDNKNSKYSVKILTDNDHPKSFLNSQIITKIASEVPQSFQNRLNYNIKKFKEQNKHIFSESANNINKGLITLMKNDLVPISSQNVKSKLPIKINTCAVNTNVLNLPTTSANLPSSSLPPGAWLKPKEENKLSMESKDGMILPKLLVSASEENKSTSSNELIAQDGMRQVPKIWVNQAITNSFDDSNKVTKNHIEEKGESSGQMILPDLVSAENLVEPKFPVPIVKTYSKSAENLVEPKFPVPIVKTYSKKNQIESEFIPGVGIVRYGALPSPVPKDSVWGSFVKSKGELEASNWLQVEGVEDGIYTLYRKIENRIAASNLQQVNRNSQKLENKIAQASNLQQVNEKSFQNPIHSQNPVISSTTNKNSTVDPNLKKKNIADPITNNANGKKTSVKSINKVNIYNPIIPKIPKINYIPIQHGKKPRKQKLVPKPEESIEIKTNKLKNPNLKLNPKSNVVEQFYLSCTSCKKTFPDIEQYNMHTEVYKENCKLRKCKLCKETCETFCDLYYHYIYHTTVDKVSYCSLTSFDFVNPKNLLLSYIKLYNQHEPGTFICFCGKLFNFRSGLITHVERYYLSCRELSVTLIKRATFNSFNTNLKEKRKTRRALRKKENDDYDFDTPKLNLPPKCRICKLEFDNRRVYLEHIRFEHTQSYICEHCQNEFTCKLKLQRHMISSHLKSKITTCTTKELSNVVPAEEI